LKMMVLDDRKWTLHGQNLSFGCFSWRFNASAHYSKCIGSGSSLGAAVVGEASSSSHESWRSIALWESQSLFSSDMAKNRRRKLLQEALSCSVKSPYLFITIYGLISSSPFTHQKKCWGYVILDEGKYLALSHIANLFDMLSLTFFIDTRLKIRHANKSAAILERDA
jgi:hypothetical protein